MWTCGSRDVPEDTRNGGLEHKVVEEDVDGRDVVDLNPCLLEFYLIYIAWLATSGGLLD